VDVTDVLQALARIVVASFESQLGSEYLGVHRPANRGLSQLLAFLDHSGQVPG
jgi:hypothetical protein